MVGGADASKTIVLSYVLHYISFLQHPASLFHRVLNMPFKGSLLPDLSFSNPQEAEEGADGEVLSERTYSTGSQGSDVAAPQRYHGGEKEGEGVR